MRGAQTGVAVVAVAALVAVWGCALSFELGVPAQAQFPGSCTGNPSEGSCLSTYSHSFAVAVNYTGSWTLNFTGQTDVGESTAHAVNGTRSGSGVYSVVVTLSRLNDRTLTLCSQATKLDGSNGTLELVIDGATTAETSSPFGTASACGQVAP